MASSVQPASVGTLPPSADVVGNAFAHQYYHILHQSPQHVHRFYLDDSKLGRPGTDGAMSITTTTEAINEKILSLNCGEFRAEIVTVDAQESLNGGVLVLVTGYLTGKDNLGRKFTQSFFLAPQEKGYFVLNDVFRYVEDTNTVHQNDNQAVVDNTVADPINPGVDASPVLESHVSEQAAVELADDNGEVINNSDDDGKVPAQEEEAEQVHEIVHEVPDDGQQVVAESNAKIEDTPKKSYASILKVMKESVPSLSTSPAAPQKSASRSQEQVSAAPPPAPVAETHISTTDVSENGLQEAEGDGHSIYVKGLPMNATPGLLATEFKKFGPIKNGGIQVRSQKGFCFGFVEFEVASAVQSALEASPLMIGGRQVVVEEKKSTSRVNNRGRFIPGRGTGYRNDGVRGRGNYGNGRNYGRNDFNNRAEYANKNGNRGGFSNRGGDGYQRGEHMGGYGGRGNRAGGLADNAAAKAAPQVTARA